MKKDSLILTKIYSIFFSFGQATKVFFKKPEMCANLDPFYLIGIFNIIKSDKKKKLYMYFIPIIFYSIVQIILLPHINILKMLINILKIVLCISIMDYVRENYKRINFKKFVIYASIFIFSVTVIALLLKNNETLWRINDAFNKYDKNRLHGLFLEPSELGFHAMILMIFLTNFYINAETKHSKRIYIFLFFLNAISLYYAKSMGSIVIGFFSIMFMLFINFVKNKKTKKNVMTFLGLILFVLIIAFLSIKFETSIWQRIRDTLNNSDASNGYRIGVSWNILKSSFVDYFGVGFGFGNLNTPAFNIKYKALGLATVVANSFQYFIIEGGIFAIFYLLWLFKHLIKKALNSSGCFRYGILSFLLLYQLFGSHFTNGIIWFIYGLCLSDYKEEVDIK